MNKFTIQDLSNEEADELMDKLNGQRYVIFYCWYVINDGNDGNYYSSNSKIYGRAEKELKSRAPFLKLLRQLRNTPENCDAYHTISI